MDFQPEGSRLYLCPSEWDGQGEPEFKEASLDEAKEYSMRAYSSPHRIGKDGKPEYRSGCVVLTDVDWSFQAKAYAEYGVIPSEVYPVDGDDRRKWLVFRFPRSLEDRGTYDRWSEAAAWAYAGMSVEAYPADRPADVVRQEIAHVEGWEDLSAAFRISEKDSPDGLNLGPDSTKLVAKCGRLDCASVAEALKAGEVRIDPVRNFVCWPSRLAGSPFFHVLRAMNGNVRLATGFFREKFAIPFAVGKDDFDNEKSAGGFLVDQGANFSSGVDGYVGITKSNGKEFRMSDFTVYAQYKVCGEDGRVENWVRLVNRASGYSTPEIELPGESGKTAFTNFLLKYKLSFWGEGDHIVELHRQVTSAPVPTVNRMNGLGFKGNLLFLGNGVYDLEKRSLTRRTGRFWFSPDGDGFLCLTSSGNSVDDLQTLPNFPKEDVEVPAPEKVYGEFKSMYGGKTGLRAVSWLFGVMGYGRFQPDRQCPMFLVHGVKGSGKTELYKLLLRAYGFKSAFGFDMTTLFAMRTLFSHLDRIPAFMSEYRNSVPYREQKTEILRCAYDRTGFSHGTADLRLVHYSFNAIPAIEGEEKIVDTAVRSRSFQIFMNAREQITDFDKKIASKTFDAALLSYLAGCHGDAAKYEDDYKEGLLIFPKAEARTKNNAACVYAGCMAILPDMKDEWKETIRGMAEECHKDMTESSGVGEFFRKLGTVTQHMFDGVRVQRDVAYLDVGQLVDAMKRSKARLALDVETYVGYADQAGYEVGYFDMGDKMMYAMKVPIVKEMDGAFLTITAIYEAWTQRFGVGKQVR